MIVDAQNQFSAAQAVTATAASTNIVDLGAIRNLGVGENLYVVVICTVAMTDSGSDSTLAVTLETDDNSGMSSVTSQFTVGTFAALAAAGTMKIARLPPDLVNERYIQLKYTPANGNLSTGTFSAYLVHDIQAFTGYASGYSVS